MEGRESLRIMYLSYYYLPHVGAATWTTYYLSHRLTTMGNEVHLIVPNARFALSVDSESVRDIEKKNPAIFHRTPSFEIPRKLGPLISAFFIFFEGLRTGKRSTIILCQYHPHHFVFLVGSLLGKIFRIPVVAWADDVYRDMKVGNLSFVDRFVRRVAIGVNTLNEAFVRYAEAFLVTCSEQLEVLESRIGRLDNLTIGHNSVDLSEFRDAPDKAEARESLGIPLGRKVLSFIGRFSGSEYGIEVLLRGLPPILEKYPEILLMLIGDDPSPSQQSLVDLLYLRNNVKIHGPMLHNEVIKFIEAADLCIGPLMPTLAIPRKVLEYMACGKPVITGVKSVSRDLAINDFNCLVVTPEPQSVSEAILRVLQDEEYARRLGLNAKRVVLEFGLDKVADELERTLLKAVNNHKEH